MWNCVRLEKVYEEYIRLVQDMYEDNLLGIRYAAGDTEA